MTMTRANIVTFADTFAHDTGTDMTLEDSFDDILDRFARSSAPFVDTETFTPTDGTAEYSYPTTAITILAIFHGATHLVVASSSELEAYDEDWRATAATGGTPIAYIFYEGDSRAVRLFPTPDTTEVDNDTFLFGENRTTDIPEWLALPIAFEMLAEEFAYPSGHQDKEMSEACLGMAGFLKAFTGIL